MRIGRWSEPRFVFVCQLVEVMREADANETSGELGLALPVDVIWSVCEVVVVPYVDAVVVICVLFVLHVCLLRGCDGARVTAMLLWGMDEMW